MNIYPSPSSLNSMSPNKSFESFESNVSISLISAVSIEAFIKKDYSSFLYLFNII